MQRIFLTPATRTIGRRLFGEVKSRQLTKQEFYQTLNDLPFASKLSEPISAVRNAVDNELPDKEYDHLASQFENTDINTDGPDPLNTQFFKKYISCRPDDEHFVDKVSGVYQQSVDIIGDIDASLPDNAECTPGLISDHLDGIKSRLQAAGRTTAAAEIDSLKNDLVNGIHLLRDVTGSMRAYIAKRLKELEEEEEDRQVDRHAHNLNTWKLLNYSVGDEIYSMYPKLTQQIDHEIINNQWYKDTADQQ